LAQKQFIYNAEPGNKMNWKNSSLALFGSDLERKSKPQPARNEESWNGLGKSVKLKVWRIEEFQVK
jgi:gelsolin